MPYRSKAQARWAHATGQPFARKWDRLTKKQRGGIKALPQHKKAKRR